MAKKLLKRSPTQKPVPEYESGDPQAFDLLVNHGALPTEPSLDSVVLGKIIPGFDSLFLRLDPKFVPSLLVGDGRRDHSMLAKVALRNATAENFFFGQRGYFKTTLLLSAVIDSLDLYFRMASKMDKQKAFLNYRKITHNSYRIRLLFTNYGLHQGWTDQPGLPGLVRDVQKIPNLGDIFISQNIGPFILALVYYCGKKSGAKDQRAFERVKTRLKESHSMQEFLTTLIETKPLRKSA